MRILKFYTPDEKVIEKIVTKIENAKDKIYIEIYMLSETRILNAIKKKKDENKNIEIKIILEKNPYIATNFNNKAYDFLTKNNINTVWSNPDNFSLNHTKLIIIDDEAIISTWNLTYSSFKYNREFFIFTQDKNIIQSLKTIFLNDYFFRKYSL